MSKIADDFTGKMMLAYEFANKLAKIENDIDTLTTQVFDGFHSLGFERVRIYAYRLGECLSWRCCDNHSDQVKKRFESGEVILSLSENEPDSYVSLGNRLPIIIAYDPSCHQPGMKEVGSRKHIYVTNADPWYEKLEKPQLDEGNTFEWLDCPLIVGTRIVGKISLDRLSSGRQFEDADLALVTPLSYLVGSAIDRNPIFEYDVFFSFDNSMWNLVQTVDRFLKDRNIRVFTAQREIEPGEKFVKKIREALFISNHIIVLFSPQCIGNAWIYAECSSAWLLGKTITVFLVNGAKIGDLPFFMSDTHCVEYSVDELLKAAERSRQVSTLDAAASQVGKRVSGWSGKGPIPPPPIFSETPIYEDGWYTLNSLKRNR